MILCLVFICKRLTLCHPLSSLTIVPGACWWPLPTHFCGAVVGLGYHHTFCCFQLSFPFPRFSTLFDESVFPVSLPASACLRDDPCMSSAAITTTVWCRMWPTLGVSCWRGVNGFMPWSSHLRKSPATLFCPFEELLLVVLCTYPAHQFHQTPSLATIVLIVGRKGESCSLRVPARDVDMVHALLFFGLLVGSWHSVFLDHSLCCLDLFGMNKL